MDKFTQEQINDLAQRIAALEAGEIYNKEKLESIEESIAATNKKVDITNTQLTNLLAKIAKWEGKFGGILFLVGCIWTFLVASWGTILGYLKYILGVHPNVGS